MMKFGMYVNKPPFILTPEKPMRERYNTLACWYPFFNQMTVFNESQAYLDKCLMIVEAESLLKDYPYKETINASRLTFQYRVPNSPAEEQFCRGQF